MTARRCLPSSYRVVPPLGGIRDPDGDGWLADLLSLLESGRLDKLRSHVDGLVEAGAEELSVRAVPLPEVEYGPL